MDTNGLIGKSQMTVIGYDSFTFEAPLLSCILLWQVFSLTWHGWGLELDSWYIGPIGWVDALSLGQELFGYAGINEGEVGSEYRR